MLLTVSGLDAAPVRFLHLWGRYVLGFKPWEHCMRCFEGKEANAIRPSMKDGEYELSDDHRFLYLCGVGQRDSKRGRSDLAQRITNVHLAVRPRVGSVAAIGSVYGVSFIIRDAQAIPIESLPEGFQGLPSKHYRCKNFQFGYQMFDVDAVGEGAARDVVHQLREWTSIWYKLG
jgi:hypothetical protein